MQLLAILAAVAAVAGAASMALVALIGLGGWRNASLDVVNSFAPLCLALAFGAEAEAWVSLDTGPLRTVTLGLALLAIVINVALVGPQLLRIRPRETVSDLRLRVLSANVWSENPTPELAIEAILARDADVLLLQETDGSLSTGLEQIRRRYPHASACPGGAVQIFLKSPVLSEGWGLGLWRLADRNAVWVETALANGRRVTLANVHFCQPLPPKPQEAMRLALATRLHALDCGDIVLAGDFNTTPWSFAMRRQDKLLRPLQRRTVCLFSWPARLGGRPWSLPILPIDHVYASPALRLARLCRIRIPGSDHFATEAVFCPPVYPPRIRGKVRARRD